MNVSFITTFRQTDPQRLSALHAVMEHAAGFPGWQIVIVEQASEPSLDKCLLPLSCEYKHVLNSDSFNKSWGMNVAMKASDGDILVVSDSDILIGRDDLLRAVDACKSELDAVRPYGLLVDMNRKQTLEYYKSSTLPSQPADGRGYDRHHAGEQLCFAGGVFVIRRSYYEQLGGMDERFTGWGGEDDAMSIKIHALSKQVAVSRQALAWHLWHPRGEPSKHDGYVHNCQLLGAYRASSVDDIRGLCAQQSAMMGDPGKYQRRTPGSAA